ncbi:hypothetical protein BJ546DRAFT_969578 [Cryomyces antarcticus]
MYYVVRNNIPSENYTSLVNETGYGRMRRLVCEEQVGLLFWHELTARASLALKAESVALADRQSSNPDEEPVDLNGQPYFERFFDFPTDCDKAYMGPPRPRPPVFPNPALLRALSAEETLVKGRVDSGACVPSDFPSVSTSAHPPAFRAEEITKALPGPRLGTLHQSCFARSRLLATEYQVPVALQARSVWWKLEEPRPLRRGAVERSYRFQGICRNP